MLSLLTVMKFCRKSNTAKENEIKQLNDKIETLEREKQADDKAMQERLHELKEEKERLEKSLVDHDSVKEELLTQKHENKYLAAELEKVLFALIQTQD